MHLSEFETVDLKPFRPDPQSWLLRQLHQNVTIALDKAEGAA